MNKTLFNRSVLLLFISAGCMSFADAQTQVSQDNEKVKKTVKEEIKPINELLAGNLDLTDKKNIIDLANSVNKSIGYDPLSAEDLEYPSIDLYGEESWSEWVNPFAGGASVEIPETYSINCTEFSYPLDGVRRVNSKYGYRRRFRRMHYGMDLQVQIGDTVRAAFDGKVRVVKYERRGYGKYIVVRHTNGLETVYGHLSRQDVKENDIVRAGDPIGLAGNTGRSTGPHLHFETRFLGIAVNPQQIIDFDSGVPLAEEYVFHRKNYGNTKTIKVANARRHHASNGSGITMHRIRKGDTLSDIAKKYGTTVSSICKMNGLSRNSNLKIGHSIRVKS